MMVKSVGRYICGERGLAMGSPKRDGFEAVSELFDRYAKMHYFNMFVNTLEKTISCRRSGVHRVNFMSYFTVLIHV